MKQDMTSLQKVEQEVLKTRKSMKTKQF